MFTRNIGKMFISMVILVSVFLTGCGSRDIPVTKNEQLLSGITPSNAAVITEAVVDVFDKPDIYSTRITQVLFNQVVKVTDEQNSWTRISLLDGTSGWVKTKYIGWDIDSVIDGGINNRIIVTAKSVDVYSGTNNKVKYKQIVMGTELYAFGKTKTGYDVLLPDNKRGWIEEGGVIAIPVNNNIIPKTTTDDFIQTLQKFKGTIYIIGGLSRWGIDSAGLVYICSRINGVDIPRQLSMMSKAGTEVPENDLQVGDLLIFSSDSTKQDIYDVGVYIGEDEFIHSSTTKGVIIDTLQDSYFKDRILSTRRIF